MKTSITNTIHVVRIIIDSCSMIFLGGMALVVIMATMSRYIFKIPIFWAEELARLFMLWMCFLGASIASRHDVHVSATFLTSMLPKKVQNVVSLFARVVVIVFMLMIIIYSLDLLPKVYLQISPTLRIPMAVAYASVPFGAAMILIENTIICIKELRNKT